MRFYPTAVIYHILLEWAHNPMLEITSYSKCNKWRSWLWSNLRMLSSVSITYHSETEGQWEKPAGISSPHLNLTDSNQSVCIKPLPFFFLLWTVKMHAISFFSCSPWLFQPVTSVCQQLHARIEPPPWEIHRLHPSDRQREIEDAVQGGRHRRLGFTFTYWSEEI